MTESHQKQHEFGAAHSIKLPTREELPYNFTST